MAGGRRLCFDGLARGGVRLCPGLYLCLVTFPLNTRRWRCYDKEKDEIPWTPLTSSFPAKLADKKKYRSIPNYEIRGMSDRRLSVGNSGSKLKYMSCDGVISSGRGTLPTA